MRACAEKESMMMDELDEHQLLFWREFHIEREEAWRALYFGSTRLMNIFITRCEELGLPEMAKNMRAYSARSPGLNKKGEA